MDSQFLLSVPFNTTNKDSDEEKYSDNTSNNSNRNNYRCAIIAIRLSIRTSNGNSWMVFCTTGIDFSEMETILTGTVASLRVTLSTIAMRITLEAAVGTIES
jgi:hypothetical protein